MAKKKAEKKEDSPTKKLLTRIRQRFPVMVEADRDNRKEALADIKFVNVPGEQWDANMKKERGDRPCSEYNRLRIMCKRIINDMRSNRPMGKVRGVEDSDKKVAEIYEGLIRNIWNISDGDTVIDYAADYQVPGGMGAWRINTKYVAEDAFEQEIVLEALQNPFCLYCDPSAKDPMKRDAQDWILIDRISKSSYQERWPNKEVVSWESTEFDDEEDPWEDDESVRIVEYWYKEPYEKEIWQLADGKVVDSTSDEAKLIDPASIKRKRSVICNRIKMCIASGDAILEQADWAGSHHPFVMVFGEHKIIDGKVRWFGEVRFSKDAQRAYNVARTAITEKVAMAPQAKFWATVDQAKGHTAKWAEAHQKNFPYLLYNADGKAPGPPMPMAADPLPAALVQESMLAAEEIKAVTGIFDASLGQEAPEKSGRAIIARQQQGEIATFNYPDNMAKGIRRTYEILIDLVPKIYDTERELRVLGSDGAEDYVTVNTVEIDPQSGEAVKVNDLAEGRYDVTVTVGPSFSTKRQEAAETYLQLAQASPEVMGVAGDLIFKAMDLPYSEDIADRLKAMLPPPIQQMLSEGKEVPPEAQAAMAQAAQAMQIVEQKNALVDQATQELQQEQGVVEKQKSEIQVLVANLKAQKAEFDAHVATEMAKLTQAKVGLQVDGANLQVKDAQLQAKTAQSALQTHEDGNSKEREGLGNQVADALKQINEMAQQFAVAASQVLHQIQQAANKPKPKLKAMEARREGGKLTAIPIYEEAPTE